MQAMLDEERQRRRRRVLTALTALAAVIGVVAVVFAAVAQRRAADEANAADFAQLISRSTDLQATQTDLGPTGLFQATAIGAFTVTLPLGAYVATGRWTRFAQNTWRSPPNR